MSTSNADSKTSAAPVAGANSFTEAEAKKRLEAHGYSDVTHQRRQIDLARQSDEGRKAGWLVATAVGAVAGAGAGAAAGGVIGSLTQAGVSEDHAHVYMEGVRRGGTLVTARVADSQVPMVEPIMRRHHPVNPDMRGKAYRAQGWTAFDETAEPYTASELERKRARDQIGVSH